MARADEAIKKDIVDHLEWDSRVDATHISVEVKGGAVTLAGVTTFHSSKRTAEELALGISGVRGVTNNIAVEYPIELPGDGEIKARIEKVLLWNSIVDSSRIKVFVTSGVVSLDGEVDVFWKVDYVGRLVSDIEGVVDIENKLAVVPPRSHIDEAIAEQIVAAIDRSMLLDIDDITVKVDRGVVTLDGKAPSRIAKRYALRFAAQTPGVVRVIDHLMVP